MSIIEQALDKLEHSESSIQDPVMSVPYEFRVHRPTAIYGKSLKTFVVLFGILLFLAFFVISQGKKLNSIDTGNEKKADIIRILEKQNKEIAPSTQASKTEIEKIDNSKIIDAPPPLSIAHKTKIPSDKIDNHRSNLIDKTSPNSTDDENNNSKPLLKNTDQALKSNTPEALLAEKRISNKAQPINKTVPVAEIKQEIFEPVIPEKDSLSELANLIPKQIEIGNYQEVISILYDYQQDLSNTWEYYYWQSQAYIGMGQIVKAENSLNTGLEKNSNQAVLWVQKGLIFQEKDNHQAAIEVFKKAELMQFKSASLYLNMGYSAAVLSDLDLAKRAYNNYLSMTKNDPKQDSSIRYQVIEYMKQIDQS